MTFHIARDMPLEDDAEAPEFEGKQHRWPTFGGYDNRFSKDTSTIYVHTKEESITGGQHSQA